MNIHDQMNYPMIAKHDIKRMLFISAVLEFWNMRKRTGKLLDTVDIARFMGCREYDAERALHEGLEIERRRRIKC